MEFYWGEIISGIFYAVVGVRMCSLSARNRQLPECLLALSFLSWAAGYLIAYIPLLPGLESMLEASSILALVFDGLGTIACAAFILVVFRSDSKWAPWLIVAFAALIIGGLWGSFWFGDVDIESLSTNPFYWFDWVGYTGVFTWLSIETFSAYSSSKRRRLLGLCGPMVCNRYLLMGLGAAFWIAVSFAVAADNVVHAITGSWIPALDYSLGVFEFISLAMFWLAFLPPATYRSWIESTSSPIEVAAQ
jgi:hypothetical protein